MNAELTCALCPEKPLVKYFDDDAGWIWLGLQCAYEKGYPLAIQLKTTAWIDNQIQRVISVEAVQ